MIKNPLNLNVYLILMISDKMATIFKIDATEDLNDSFSSYSESVNEHIEYKYSHSFLVLFFFFFAKYILAITSAFNVQNALYMEPFDENNDFSCIYFCMNLI